MNKLNLETATAAELVAFHNEHADKPVTRFATRAAGLARVKKLIVALGLEREVAAAAQPATKAAPAAPHQNRSAAIRASWADPAVAAKRAERHSVVVDNQRFDSVRAAFVALNLPLSKHIKFRAELKSAGKLVVAGRTWRIEQR